MESFIPRRGYLDSHHGGASILLSNIDAAQLPTLMDNIPY